MSCARVHEIELLDFLAEPRRAEFDAFRAHYPHCAACAAELRAWTDLELRLRSGRAEPHPDPERLAAYEEDRRALAPADRERIAFHLAGCRTCREELRAAEAFVAAGPIAAAAPARTRSRLLDAFAALGRLAWSPAFAYGVALLVIGPLLFRVLGEEPGAVVAPTRVSEPVAEAAPAAPEGVAVREVARPVELADRPAAAPPVAPPSPERQPEQAPERAELRALGYGVDAGEARAQPPEVAYAQQPELVRSADVGTKLEAEASGFASEQAPGLPAEADAADLVRASRARADLAQSEARTDAAFGPPVLELETGVPATVASAWAAAGLRLRVPVPGSLRDEAELKISVQDAGARRVLGVQLALGPGATHAELEVPPGWLTPGPWRVSLARTTAGEGERAFEFSLVVAEP